MNPIIISQDLLHYLQIKTEGQFSINPSQEQKTRGQFIPKFQNSTDKWGHKLFLHSKFKNTANFVDSSGYMFSVIAHRNFVPMSIYIDNHSYPGIRVEDLKEISGRHLYFSEGRPISLASATVWNPYYYLLGDLKLHGNREFLKELIINTVEDTGITPSLKNVLFNIDENEYIRNLSSSDKIYTLKFKDILQRLFNGACHNNTDNLFENLNMLIGLGMGLTPSGDDFVSGFIWGMRLQGKNDLAQSLIKHIVGISKSSTNDISSQFLNFTLENKLSIHQKYFIYSLSRCNQHNIARAFSKLKQWGHSSGIDWICGVYGGWILTI